MRSEPEHILNALVEFGELRVWSVIITIFGDLNLAPGASISASNLLALTHQLGIKPDAFRVAIHRLKNDGWIEADRTGRTSRYRLSEHGKSESLAARRRIYAKNSPTELNQTILIAPPTTTNSGGHVSDSLRGAGAIQIAPRVFLADNPNAVQSCRDLGFLVLACHPESVPDWFREIVCSHELTTSFAQLLEILEALADFLASPNSSPDELGPALRILTVHRWRQLLLKHPELPAPFFPDGWKGERCREMLHTILELLPLEQMRKISNKN